MMKCNERLKCKREMIVVKESVCVEKEIEKYLNTWRGW